jgi:formylglycine-generating enzyme
MDEDSLCCSPFARREDTDGLVSGGPGSNPAPVAARQLSSVRVDADPAARGMVFVPAGEFLMGSDDDVGYAADGEGPVHRVSLRPFWIDPYAVTNAHFGEFIAATGYVTDAERFGWSFVFAGLLPDDFPETRGVAAAPWWRQVEGASWRHPEGRQSDINARWHHPVVHVSWTDAVAYCAWAGGSLPTEAQWEYAARGGLHQKRYPWGNELSPGGVHRCNIWQGQFPRKNTCEDGHFGTAPVDAFQPNGLGLYNMVGNVWEWCRDWFSPGYYVDSALDDPPGPSQGTHRVIRGGSYLCHESYCFRYRVAARSASTPDSSSGNTGFRVARDN